MLKIKTRLKYTEILFAFVLLVFSSVIFGGCSGTDGYRYIRSITFMTAGEEITKSSTCVSNYMSLGEITEAEFMASPSKDRVYTLGGTGQVIAKSQLPPKNKMGTLCYTTTTGVDTEHTYYAIIEREYDVVHPVTYFKFKYTGRTYYYIMVKIVDNSTIKIREWDVKKREIETTYTVTSYSILELL